jgi:hypothetical protein
MRKHADENLLKSVIGVLWVIEHQVGCVINEPYILPVQRIEGVFLSCKTTLH